MLNDTKNELNFPLQLKLRTAFRSLIFYKEFKETSLLTRLPLHPEKTRGSGHKQHFAVSKQVRGEGAGNLQV